MIEKHGREFASRAELRRFEAQRASAERPTRRYTSVKGGKMTRLYIAGGRHEATLAANRYGIVLRTVTGVDEWNCTMAYTPNRVDGRLHHWLANPPATRAGALLWFRSEVK